MKKKSRKAPKIGVLGGGSWATALVKVLTHNQHSVRWWMRDNAAIKHIKKYNSNPKYLRSVYLNPKLIRLHSRVKQLLSKVDVLILAIPSAYISQVMEQIPAKSLEGKIIVSGIKGIIPEKNQIIGIFLHEAHAIPLEKIVVISGPCHAEEVAQEKLSYLTFAGQNAENTNLIAELFDCRFVKTSTSDDIYGTEYSAVIKNIIAIASGICHGLGYGDNFQAVLISNAIQEIKRFVDAVHPIDRDIKGSAYLGDLIVTTYSQFSRNRTFGNMLGKGYSVRSAQMEMSMVAEGYYAVQGINKIRDKANVDMPITEAVNNILFGNISPAVEMQLLADRLS